mmetsp:Transcript_36020/g.102001  ORF Transcript_36020/g.102001 Transcript_36020/m.102001 type:complete len:356 (+) Transcript_36020:323-1390(+)|eukprot:CAMPEP_0117667682 /NCGR_PEP_ID=MMETSP0804-20121206/11113_1 /TAXON_ID=1074897 /ORGANISM="Tetraselmis astigmatica, Strain CCMP880" /LENGTH=355 /DNA_ID=CAMNT_0005475457 /DNA_START=297 /DNA_END=1364 /DNA_ORIENTATION=+
MSKTAAAAAKRQMQIQGYTAFIRALAVNSLDWRHEKLMSDVRKELSVDAEQHLAIIEQVMTDPDITAIREGKPPPRSKEAPPPQPALESPAPMPSNKPGATPGSGNLKKRKDMQAGNPQPPPQAVPPRSQPQQMPKSNKKAKRPKEIGAPGAMGPLTPQQWLGRIVERLWGTTWLDALVTEYDPVKGLHCLTYEFGSSNETKEWYSVAQPSKEFRPTARTVDLAEMAKAHRNAKANQRPASLPSPAQPPPAMHRQGSITSKGSTKPQNCGSLNTMPDPPASKLEAKIRSADAEELGKLMALVQTDEARLRAELIEIGGSDDEEGEVAALNRLTKEWDRLTQKENRLRKELQALEG